MKCYLQLCKNVHIGIQSDPNQNITEKLYYYISEDWFRESPIEQIMFRIKLT